MENKFYVYLYLDPRKSGSHVYGEYKFEYEPFYVGKGSGDRCLHHLKEFRKKQNPNKKFVNKINKIYDDLKMYPIIIKYFENLNERIAFELEMNMVDVIGRADKKLGPLCNLSKGGDGGLDLSDYVIDKISETQKNNYILHPEKRQRNVGNNIIIHSTYNRDTIIKCRDLRNNGKTYEEISQILNISRATISKWCRDIKKPVSSIKYSKEIVDECCRLRKQGKTYREITEILNIGGKTVEYWFKKYNKGDKL